MSHLWPWILLALLGAFHGLNPAMGWLFAVAMGFQERRLRVVIAALGPIALGHAIAIGLIAIPIGLLQLAIPQSLLMTLGGIALLLFAIRKIVTRFRHPRWVGFRVNRKELTFWSFLMATAHGAGLMLVPVLVRLRSHSGDAEPSHAAHASLATSATAHSDHMGAGLTGHAGHVSADDSFITAVAATAFHTGVMIVVMGVIAVVVYRQLGVEIVRRAWINFDWIWVGVLLVTGGTTLAFGLWPMLVG